MTDQPQLFKLKPTRPNATNWSQRPAPISHTILCGSDLGDVIRKLEAAGARLQWFGPARSGWIVKYFWPQKARAA